MSVTEQLTLRPYQEDAQQQTIAEFLSPTGAWRLLGVNPTAAGKTVIFSTLHQQPAFQAYLESFPVDQRKTLVIAHREELLTQAKAKFERYSPTLRVEIEQADKWASPDADVVIASIQTLAGRTGKRLMRFKRNQFRLIVVDESHHSPSPSYLGVLQYFGLLPPAEFMPKPRPMDSDDSLAFQRARLAAWDATGKPARLLLGVTATPRRADRIGLEVVFQKIVFEETIINLMRQGYLSRMRALRITSTVSLDHVRTSGGDFDERELAAAVDNVERNRVIVKGWTEHATDRKTVAFCASVQHAKDLADEFCAAGVKAAAIHGKSTDRAELLHDFEFGDLEVLTNFGVLTEGTDISNIECIVHARPTKSSTLFVQMSGRGLRLHPGKEFCLLLDIVDITSKHSLMSASTLMGLPAEYDTAGRDLVDEVDRVEAIKAKNPLVNPEGARSLEELEAMAHEVDLFAHFKPPEIANATMAWMKNGEEYQITYTGPSKVFDETLRIAPNKFGGWDIIGQEENGNPSPVPLAQPSPDLSVAVTRAEAFIREHRSNQLRNLLKDAPWRSGTMTPRARKFMNALVARAGLNIDTSTLRAGDGAEVIEYCKQALKGRITQ